MSMLPFSDCYVFGDNSQYAILEWITGRRVPQEYRDREICAAYAKDPAVEDAGKTVWIYTDKLLPGITIHFSNLDRFQMPELLPFSRCILVTRYPWDYRDLRELYQYDLRNHSVVWVLLDMQRRTGSTDLDSPEQKLKEQCRAFEEEQIPYHVIHSLSQIYGVLNWSEPFSGYWSRKCLQYLDYFDIDIEDFPGPVCEDALEELLSQDAQVRVCSLESIQRYAKPYIWDCYGAAAETYFFPNSHPTGEEGLYTVVSAYRELLLNQNLAAWDIDQDCDQLWMLLRRCFREALADDRRAHVPIRGWIDLAEYERIKNTDGPEKHIDQHFWLETVCTFVRETVPRILSDRLKQHYTRLEELLT